MKKRKAAVDDVDRGNPKAATVSDKRDPPSSDSDSGDSDGGGIPLAVGRQSNDDDEDCSDDEGPLNVTFEFRDPNSDSFGAIRSFLRHSPLQAANTSELAFEVSDQAQIGTVVIQEEMEDIFAFISALNLGLHREKSCFNNIRTFLLEKCPVGPKKSQLENLLESSGTGILLREGMVNLPPEIFPALHHMLVTDIEWASENADGESEERDSTFTDLIFIAPYCDVSSSSASSSSPSLSSSSSSSGPACSDGCSRFLFDRFDDDILAQAATLEFQFEAEVEGSTRKYFVGIISFERYVQAVREMSALVPERR